MNQESLHLLYKYDIEPNQKCDIYGKRKNCGISCFLALFSLFCICLFVTGSMAFINGLTPNVLCSSRSEHRIGHKDIFNDKIENNDNFIFLLKNCNDTNTKIIPLISQVYCYDKNTNLCFNVTNESLLYQYAGIVIVFISILSQFFVISCFIINKKLS